MTSQRLPDPEGLMLNKVRPYFSEAHEWRRALAYSSSVTVALLGVFAYWFVVANRSIIFLYGHLGATALDPRTASRYWMSGLVAAGIVLVSGVTVNLALGRLLPSYHPPAWWHLWISSTLPLAVGIYLITTRCNSPTLPPRLGIKVALATSGGLLLAFVSSEFAARHPEALGWLTFAGAGLAGPLLLFRAIELSETGLLEPGRAQIIAAGGVCIGTLWTLACSLYYTYRHGRIWTVYQLLLAGATISYLLLPLVHHLFFVPAAYRYISVADNFFAQTPHIQALTFLITIGASVVVVKYQRKYATGRGIA